MSLSVQHERARDHFVDVLVTAKRYAASAESVVERLVGEGSQSIE